jgi:uncharacterized membrane protein YeiB
MSMKPTSLASKRERERGAALVVAILVLAILTVIGIALMLITSTETRIAANEWSVNRAFYSSDAGVRWSSVQMSTSAQNFLTRQEFGTKAAPIWTGSVLFQMPSHRFVTGTGFFGTDDIQVRVGTPGRLSRRCAIGLPCNTDGAMYMWTLESRATGAQNDAFLNYSKSLVADVEFGPSPSLP